MDAIKTLRSYRIANIAILDLASSVLVVGWLNQRFGTGSFAHGAVAAIPIGVVAHWAFSIDTELNHKLGISAEPVRSV